MSIHSNHPFHLVEKSPWPILASMSAFMMMSGLLKMMYHFNMNLIILALLNTMIISMQWWRDISREATLQGLHSLTVMNMMRWGMILFIASEVMFFFSFFWTFFNNSLNASMEIGNQWPPVSIMTFDPLQIPLLNTAILLASGVTITWSHHAFMENNHSQAYKSMILTIMLGLYFSLLQMLEYQESTFTITDSTYGSIFFMATGFHGLHVMIGTTFITVNLSRLIHGHFSNTHHIGMEASIWYWHFVDVVWLFLYISIYWWGS